MFNTYGQLSTAALLHRYGFTEYPHSRHATSSDQAGSFLINNPFDICNVDVNMVIEGVRGCLLGDPKARQGVMSARMGRSCVRICSDFQFPPLISQSSSYYEFNFSGQPQTELLLLIKLMLSSEVEVLRIGEQSGNVTTLSFLATALGWKMTTKTQKVIPSEEKEDDVEEEVRRWILSSKTVCSCLLHVLDLRERMYPGSRTLEDDKASLLQLSVIDHSREFCALVLRVSEREILQKCREWLEKHASGNIDNPRGYCS